MHTPFSVLKWLRSFVCAAALLPTVGRAADAPATPGAAVKVPDKLVVLTFDDSVASHATIVGPLLKSTASAPRSSSRKDSILRRTRFSMTWAQIKGLHEAGFEIGNHTRHHQAVNGQKPAQFDADLEYIEQQCAAHQIPRPTSFCYPGYATSAAALPVLRGRGYRFARAGGARAFNPAKDEPLLMPQAFDSSRA